MKINTFNKTLLAAFMAVSLAACTNSGTPESSAAENTAVSTEASEENKDIIDESIKEDSENNKPAEENESVDKEEETENKDSQTAGKKEEKDSTIDVKKEEEAQASNQEQSQENNDIKYEERDGLYFSTLAASKNGERDEEFNSPYLANLKIEGDTLTVEGTIDYLVNPEDFESAEKYESASYNFKLSDNVTLQAVGGLAEPEYFSKEEFVEYYQKVKDSGLALKIDVENGIVTTVSFAS
ncbi:hypothetical protein ACF3NF_04045 [Anaerococcus martiniensis]|uniref:hypothetical protein n=1 Tax=Anaerococcus sp. WGS1579 TaxID=3366809 RepID=UPI00372D65B4